MIEPIQPEFTLVEGRAEIATTLARLVGDAKQQVDLLSQQLDRDLYGTDDFVDHLRRFVLQHRNTRVRLLVNQATKALAGSPRLVELCRAMTAFVEVRELLPERRTIVTEEVLITDGRQLLLRPTSEAVSARLFETSPTVAHLRQKDFTTLWEESQISQELRGLRL